MLRSFMFFLVWAFWVIGLIAGLGSWLLAWSFAIDSSRENDTLCEPLFWNGLTAFEFVAGMSLAMLIFDVLEEILIQLKGKEKGKVKPQKLLAKCTVCGKETDKTHCCGRMTYNLYRDRRGV